MILKFWLWGTGVGGSIPDRLWGSKKQLVDPKDGLFFSESCFIWGNLLIVLGVRIFLERFQTHPDTWSMVTWMSLKIGAWARRSASTHPSCQVQEMPGEEDSPLSTEYPSSERPGVCPVTFFPKSKSSNWSRFRPPGAPFLLRTLFFFGHIKILWESFVLKDSPITCSRLRSDFFGHWDFFWDILTPSLTWLGA